MVSCLFKLLLSQCLQLVVVSALVELDVENLLLDATCVVKRNGVIEEECVLEELEQHEHEGKSGLFGEMCVLEKCHIVQVTKDNHAEF